LIPIKDNIPSDRFPFATLALIVANVVVYLLTIGHGGSLLSGPDAGEVARHGAIPYALTHLDRHCGLVHAVIACPGPGTVPTWPTLFSSMFMHASILHLAGNMLFLWIFANNVERAMGPVKLIVFYIAAGLAALALQVALHPSSTAPTIGAAGAIAGVLGGYILLYPRARVLTLVLIPFFSTVIELPALLMLGAWFAMQALFGAVGLTDPLGGGGAVAYFAHVGGFLFGLVAIRLLVSRRTGMPPGDAGTPPTAAS